MARKNTPAQNAAELTAGSAERIIEDRSPIAIDGLEGDVSDRLVQATPDTDVQLMDVAFDALDMLFKNEHEYSDRETGEIKTSNSRWFARNIVLRGIIRNLAFVIDKANERAERAEKAVNAVKFGKTADEDGTELARLEAWAERETTTVLEYVAMHAHACSLYVKYVGEPHDAMRQPKKEVPPTTARVEARKQALAALRR